MVIRKLQSVLTLVAFLSLGTISVTAAVVVFMNRLPDPMFADSRELFRWLVTRDVEAESPETQQKLVYRIESELRQGIDQEELSSSLDEPQRRMLLKNVEFLAKVWFRQKVHAYFAAPQRDRDEYLDRQIEDIQSWGTAHRLLAGEQKASRGDASTMTTVMAKVRSWIDEAPPEERPRMIQFIAAVQTRLWARRFQTLTGFTQ